MNAWDALAVSIAHGNEPLPVRVCDPVVSGDFVTQCQAAGYAIPLLRLVRHSEIRDAGHDIGWLREHRRFQSQ